MKLNFVYLRATNLVSCRAIGPYETSAKAAWAEMFAWLDESGLRGRVNRGFGLAHDDPRKVASERCRYDACIDVPDALPPTMWQHLMPQRLPGGAYTRFRHVGPHHEIGATISRIRNDWCPTTGTVPASDRPVVEIYLDDPGFCEPEKLRTDLCLPVAFAADRNVA